MELINYIRDNKNWENILSNEPYNLKISKIDGYVLLYYNLFSSDFSSVFCREARGLVLDEQDSYKPMCLPFKKFFNYGEPNADIIDWNTAKLQFKLDGSLIKIWQGRNSKWNISTNKQIFADTNFLNMVLTTFDSLGYTFEMFEPGKTYLFELCHPFNQIVVQYDEPMLWHLATIDNSNWKEIDRPLPFKAVVSTPVSSLEICLEMLKELDSSHEGFVVTDIYSNRIKLKTDSYIYRHHLLSDTITSNLTLKKLLQFELSGDRDEILSYRPQLKPHFDELSKKLETLYAQLNKDWELLRQYRTDRKNFAFHAKNTKDPHCMFALFDNKFQSVRDYVQAQVTEKILRLLEKE